MTAPPPPPPLGRLLAGPALATVVAIVLARDGRVPLALGLVAVAVLVTHASVVSPAGRRHIDAAVGAISGAATKVLTAVVVVVSWGVTVLPAWLVGRLLGHGADRAWLMTEAGRGTRPTRPFGPHGGAGPFGRSARRRFLVLGGLVVVAVELVAVATVQLREWRRTDPVVTASAGYDTVDTPALAGREWAPATQAEMAEVSAEVVYTPFTALSIRDHRGEHVNVEGRVRRSWVAPESTPGDPFDVWFFGGSTMFGFDLQRDAHTIPSEVVRLAAADGREVRARNYGSTAHSSYQEAVLLSILLTGGEQPDLVVFYDGINDTSLQLLNAVAGLNPTGEPSILSAGQLREALVSSGGVPGGTSDPPTPLLPEIPRDDRFSVDEIVDATTGTYGQAVELARTLGERHGVPILHFWQPDMFSRTPLDPGEEVLLERQGLDEDRLEAMRRLTAAIRAELPDGVHDISDAYDTLDEPVLTDVVHVNEEGAQAVAQAMWPVIAQTWGDR